MPSPAHALCDALPSLLAQAQEGMACFDATQRLLWCNPAFAKVFGSTAEALQGETLNALDARLAPLLAQQPATSGPLLQCYTSLGTPSAVTVRLAQGREWALRGLPGPNGSFNLYLSSLSATPMQRHSEFLSTAAHELRNPVASIFGFAQLLRSRKLKPEGLAEVTEILCRQADSLSHLVEELLDLARVDAKQGQDFKPQAVSLTAMIQEARDSLPAGLNPQRLHVRIAASADLLWVDRSKALRVLINVLSNALKYSPLNTPVEVQAKRQTNQPQWADIEVVDHGIGMSAEQQARIFERFYRADPSGPIPGTGLGMSLVQELVVLMGGSVQVKSALGQGSCVSLALPLAARHTKDQPLRKGCKPVGSAPSVGGLSSPSLLGEKQGA